MRIFKNFLVLLIGIIAFSSVSVSAQNFSAKNARTLEQKIFKELIKLPYYGVFDHIAYEIKGDTVILQGKVYNAMNKKQAEREVMDIEGVRNVVNNIEILPLSSLDNSIRYQTLRTFADRGGLYRYLWEPNPSVRIIVDRGHITLEGYVANRGDYNLMNILANGVPGVFSVQNNLKVGKADF